VAIIHYTNNTIAYNIQQKLKWAENISAQGWGLGLFSAKLRKFGRFHKWFGHKYFVWPFVSIFGNLAGHILA